MNDLKTRLTLDGSDFSKQMDNAASSVNDFQKKTQDTSKTIDDMSKATKRSASELLKEMKSMEGLGRSTSNYRQQLAQMTRQIQDLSINYSKMTDEMKNSDFGREVASQIQELTKQAAEYRDAIGDATQATRLLASDTANLDAAKSALQGLSAGMQLFASMGILGEENTEKVVKALAKLKAIETATNAVITIANTLNKDSILMLKIKALQTRAATRATVANTAATKGATIAQRAFNVAAKANPYVLLASAIIAVIGAVVGFTKATEENTAAQEAQQKKLEEARKKYEAYADAIATNLSTYKRLQETWSRLKTDLEKTEFLKDAKKDFDQLALSVNNIEDAEKILVENSDKVIKAFSLRAQAAAAASLATEAYRNALIKEQELANNTKKSFTANQAIPEYGYQQYKTERAQRAGKSFVDQQGQWRFTEQGAKEASEMWRNIEGVNSELKKADEWTKQQVDLLKQANDLVSELGTKQADNNANNSNNKKTFDSGSVADYDKKIQDLNNSLKNRNLTEQETINIQRELLKLEKERADLVTSQEYAKIRVGPIPELKPMAGALDNRQIEIKAKAIVEDVDIDVSFNDLNKQIGNAVSGLGAITSSINSVYSTWANLSDSLEDKNPFESTLVVLSSVFSTLQSICSVIDTMNTLSELFNTISATSWLLEKKKNQEKAKEIALESGLTGVKATNAAIDTTGAAASVAKSASAVPVVGWVLALAAVAGIIALIASAKNSVKFAKGGIVPGSSFSGDNISAQLNSGEMVLNKPQQKRLFDLLNSSGPTGGGQVEFVIKGQDLVGVQKNYNKKMSRI